MGNSKRKGGRWSDSSVGKYSQGVLRNVGRKIPFGEKESVVSRSCSVQRESSVRTSQTLRSFGPTCSPVERARTHVLLLLDLFLTCVGSRIKRSRSLEGPCMREIACLRRAHPRSDTTPATSFISILQSPGSASEPGTVGLSPQHWCSRALKASHHRAADLLPALLRDRKRAPCSPAPPWPSGTAAQETFPGTGRRLPSSCWPVGAQDARLQVPDPASRAAQ